MDRGDWESPSRSHSFSTIGPDGPLTAPSTTSFDTARTDLEAPTPRLPHREEDHHFSFGASGVVPPRVASVGGRGSPRDNVAREGFQHRRSDSVHSSLDGRPGEVNGYSPIPRDPRDEDRLTPQEPYRDSIDVLEDDAPVSGRRPTNAGRTSRASYQSTLIGSLTLSKLGFRSSSAAEGDPHVRMESVGERTLAGRESVLDKPSPAGGPHLRAEDLDPGRNFASAPTSRGGILDSGVNNDDYEVPSFISQDPSPPGPLQRQLARLFAPLRHHKFILRLERLINGPSTPRLLLIRPWFPRVESLLTRLSLPLSYPRFPLLTVIFLIAWLLANIFLIRASWYTSSTNFGPPDVAQCTDSIWSRNAGCGLNGSYCEPFEDNWYPFRCPAGCASVQLLNTRTIGDLGVIYRPLVIGGGSSDDPESSPSTNATYRADSFICQAALHAGLFGDRRGGCGVLTQVGAGREFTTSTRNGIVGTPYAGEFPSTYQFWGGVESSGCEDLRYEILAFNVVMSVIFSLVLRPFPLLFFWTLCCVGFWLIALATDPSTEPPVTSTAFGTFLPFLFICYAFWRSAWRYVLPAFSKVAVLERTVWYLGSWWVGVLFNMTLETLPVQRLTAADIQQQPGGLVTVIIGGIIVLLLILQQLFYLRRAGILLRYLYWYALGVICICLLLAIPGFSFRFHHYFAAIVLTPGTAILTRPSAIFQGFLLGMFSDGAARWGFESILQTPAELLGDAAQGTALPAFATNSTNFATTALQSQLISFLPIPTNLTKQWNQFALLVDDVLLYQGAGTNWSFAGLDKTIQHYFRLAYALNGAQGDFTQAAVWFPSNQSWYDPLPGPS